jgi:WD40 repeat protein
MHRTWRAYGYRAGLAFALALSIFAGSAQEPSPVIDRSNRADLIPVTTVTFSDLLPEVDFGSGWFAIDSGAQHMLVADAGRNVWLLAERDESWQVVASIDVRASSGDEVQVISGAVDNRDGEVYWAALFRDAQRAYVITRAPDGTIRRFRSTTGTLPQEIWWDDGRIWLEVLGQDDPTVPLVVQVPEDESADFDPAALGFAYAPALDEGAVVRVGRVPVPLAVTSSLDGEIRLWDIQQGRMLKQVATGLGEPAVFGAVNQPPEAFLWRDNAITTLYLSTFASGETRQVRRLDGDYAQWVFLSREADVGIAVLVNRQPIVQVWDLVDGSVDERGAYLACGRPADMARLSTDGRALVIGCAEGFQVWRVRSQP